MEKFIKSKTIIILLFFLAVMCKINALNNPDPVLAGSAHYPYWIQMMQYTGAPVCDNGMWQSDLFSATNAPMANFSFNPSAPCQNETVQLTDLTVNFPDTWSWSFSPSSVTFVNSTNSNSQSPQVQFNENTNYTISLTVSNSLGSSTVDIPVTLGGINTPFFKSFESGDFPGSWNIVNSDYATTWEITTAGGNGPNANPAGLNFYYYYPPGQLDEMITEPIQLYGTLHPYLKFKVAYRQYSPGYSDGLKVFVSTDCGATWGSSPVYDKSGSTLATGPDQTNLFIPAVSSDWRLDSIDLTPYYLNSVKIKFQAVNGYGNNLYVDNISVAEQPVLMVKNVMVPNGESSCYNATQTVKVAGSGTTFIVQNGGSATFVAGQNILFLPGASVNSGGYLQGYITTDATYCGVPAPSMVAAGIVDREKESHVAAGQPLFKVYPNPTTGTFTLELTSAEETSSILVEIYGIMGDNLYTKKMSGEKKQQISMENKPAGGYIIRVTSGMQVAKTMIIKE